jgi:hypothetical protein
MPDISQINVGGIVYDVKDQAARTGKQNAITATGILKGNGSSVVAAQAGVDYAAPVRDITATLTVAGWTGDAAPYTQTVTGLAGVTAASKLEIGLAETATDEEYEASVNAKLRAVSSGSGSVTVKAYGTKPAMDIPVLVRMVG